MPNLFDDADTEPVRGLAAVGDVLDAYRQDRPAVVALDSESPHFDWFRPENEPFAFTLSWGLENSYYLEAWKDEAPDEQVASLLWNIFQSTPKVIGHNMVYDLHVLNRFWKHWQGAYPMIVREVEDTMLLDACVDEKRPHGLKPLCDHYNLHFGDSDASELQMQVKQWIEAEHQASGREPGYDEVPLKLMVPYATQDAYLTIELYNVLMAEAEAQVRGGSGRKDVLDIYALERQLLWVMYDAEERGMRIDVDFCYDQLCVWEPQLEVLRAELSNELGFPLNPGSTDDIAQALEQLGFGDAVWTNPATGKKNLPEWRMEQLAEDPALAPIVGKVLKYREVNKVVNSYFKNIIADSHADDAGQTIVHPNARQVGARTGRMSVTRPAVQTLPKETGNVRGAFIARDGHSLIFADYAAQEIRVLGHYLSAVGDNSVKAIFDRDVNADPHLEMAALLFNVPSHKVTKAQRTQAKTINFGLIYGMGQNKLALSLGLELDAAKKLLYAYYDRMPGIRKLKDSAKKAMASRGYIITAYGRRHREVDGRKAYKAVNSLVQGTSADLTKAAILKIDKAFIHEDMKSRYLLAVHDEVIVEAPDDELGAAQLLIEKAMVDCPEISVPMAVSMEVAKRWSDAV